MKTKLLTIFSIFLTVFVFMVFVSSINIVSTKNISEQASILEEAIRKDIVQCYALEGKYPESITYLEKHYGLNYDKSVFYVDYIPIGSNIMPYYTVIYVGK